MAATTAGYEWPRPRANTYSHPTDTPSPMYPDRLIRPLPKRRLRNRLSPEQASALLYPPAPPTTQPLFSFPYGQIGKENQSSQATRVHPDEAVFETCDCGHPSEHEYESEDYEDDRELAKSPTHGHGHGSRQYGMRTGGPPPPASADSSNDDYESFENTANKKKRKIPVSGAANGHHTTNLSVDLTNMSLSNGGDATAAADAGGGAGQYYQGSHSSPGPLGPSTPGSGTGISGAGRGRFGRAGRAAMERRPLGASTNAMNAYFNGPKTFKNYVNGAGSEDKESPPDQGIISQAIASAAEHAPSTPPKGSENVSLLQQEATKTTPKSQFTFTCGSDSANKMIWPGGNTTSMGTPTPSNMPPHNSRIPVPVGTRRAQGTQTGPHAPMPSPSGSQAQAGAQQGQGAQPPPPKPRRRRDREAQYAYNARQRREQQYEYNLRHPPSREEIWICEFCEYEAIFGEPPVALIRQYEAKDRRERKRAAEKRRLLEKAKMKGRKGRKGKNGKKDNHANNNAAANAAANAAPAAQAQQDHQYDDAYYEDEDDYTREGAYDNPPTPAPAPSPAQTTPVGKMEGAGGGHGHGHGTGGGQQAGAGASKNTGKGGAGGGGRPA